MKVVKTSLGYLLPRLILITLFFVVTAIVIAYARGYRFNIQTRTLTSTGILNINSTPEPAKVYINGELQGVTDINLTLPYGQYSVEVTKDGYTSWKKDVSLQGEIVMSFQARLFSKNPSLTPLTSIGINKAIPVGNTDNYILVSQNGDIEKDGLYLFNARNRPLTLFPPLSLVLSQTLLPEDFDISKVEMTFSPNFDQAIIEYSNAEEIDKLEDINSEDLLDVVPVNYAYLISLENENTEIFDISQSVQNVKQAWSVEKNKQVVKVIRALPRNIRNIAEENFYIISLSPDEKKLLYVAKNDTTIPMIIDPPLIGTNQTEQTRTIKTGGIYVYDTKEDKNFQVPVSIPLKEIIEQVQRKEPSLTNGETDLSVGLELSTDTPEATAESDADLPQVWNSEIFREVTEYLQWFPTSDYFAYKGEDQIELFAYDGTNRQVVYSGPYDNSFFALSPDWNLLVLINLNPQNNEIGDLYSIGIK